MKEQFFKNAIRHNLTYTNSFIGFVIESVDGFSITDLSRFLKFELNHYKYSKNEKDNNGEYWNFIETPIDLVPCSNFENMHYPQNQLEKMLCPNMTNLTIGGDWAEEKFEFLEYLINQCTNTTEYSDCYPLEIQKEKTYSLYANLYFRDNLIDPKNYTNPVQEFYRSIFMTIDSNMYKEMNVYFKSAQITSDIGFLMESKEFISNYMYDQFLLDAISRSEACDLIATISIYAIQKNLNIERSYKFKNLQQV